MNKPPLTRIKTTKEKLREELASKKVTALIHKCMEKSNVDFKQLQKVLAENGINISISTLRKKVQGGRCKALFVFEVASALGYEIDFYKKHNP